jgi:hypothetical protein
MEAICSFETSVEFQRTTRRYIPDDSTLHNHRCETLKSYTSNLKLDHHQLFLRPSRYIACCHAVARRRAVWDTDSVLKSATNKNNLTHRKLHKWTSSWIINALHKLTASIIICVSFFFHFNTRADVTCTFMFEWRGQIVGTTRLRSETRPALSRGSRLLRKRPGDRQLYVGSCNETTEFEVMHIWNRPWKANSEDLFIYGVLRRGEGQLYTATAWVCSFDSQQLHWYSDIPLHFK